MEKLTYENIKVGQIIHEVYNNSQWKAKIVAINGKQFDVEVFNDVTGNLIDPPQESRAMRLDGVYDNFVIAKEPKEEKPMKEFEGIKFSYHRDLSNPRRVLTIARKICKKPFFHAHFGYAICNPSDDFSKEVGRQMSVYSMNHLQNVGAGEVFVYKEETPKHAIIDVLSRRKVFKKFFKTPKCNKCHK